MYVALGWPPKLLFLKDNKNQVEGEREVNTTAKAKKSVAPIKPLCCLYNASDVQNQSSGGVSAVQFPAPH